MKKTAYSKIKEIILKNNGIVAPGAEMTKAESLIIRTRSILKLHKIKYLRPVQTYVVVLVVLSDQGLVVVGVDHVPWYVVGESVHGFVQYGVVVEQ